MSEYELVYVSVSVRISQKEKFRLFCVFLRKLKDVVGNWTIRLLLIVLLIRGGATGWYLWAADHPALRPIRGQGIRSFGHPCLYIPPSLRESLDHSVAAAPFSIPVSSARPSRIDSPSLSSVALASVRVCQATHRRCDGSGGVRGLRGHRPSSRRQPTASQL